LPDPVRERETREILGAPDEKGPLILLRLRKSAGRISQTPRIDFREKTAFLR